ncbi:Predicted arabinose efflux permease, MFS family [Amycolatopsis arida]|uniref:Predicted arabinose efflux permease, MFS family n=1 Tax=Amycolatopsis arida TaxID=587909 RepID=A0A1I6AKJ4_9PSEU|nr:MFS transporter [Amycolatopsis arida]TDX87355.1 putative MFS family arabinose efflux permease [Amycolatopsis arida]SFQ69251.1 Predicted arabinose efflux permease, MFS family [Amycolatopsis arida]
MAARRRGLRTVLRNPGYRRLFAAQTISRWGDTVTTVALIVLVFRLTGSGLGVGGVVIAEILPVLLLAPVAGAVVDRLPRVRVMVLADVARMLLAVALPLVDQHVVTVFAVAFGLSAGSVFFNPASASTVPALVDEDELVAANSGLWSAAVVSQIALAPLAGAMVAAWGTDPAFWFNAATFAGSALALTGLRPPRSPAAVSSASWVARVVAGPRLVVRDRLLRLLAVVQLLAALSAGATSALLVVLAERRLGTGAGGFGLLMGAIGVGAALGPLLLTVLTADPRRPALIFGPYLLRGLVDLVLAVTRSLPTAMVALTAYGVGTSTGMVTYHALLQAEVPEHSRGRVFAAFDLLWQTGRLASIGLGGLAADLLGIQVVYALGGALLLLAGTLGLAGLRGGAGSASRRDAR